MEDGMHVERECRLLVPDTTGKGGSGGLSVREHKLELRQNDIPVSTSGTPVFGNLPTGEIEHFTQRIIVGKAGFVPGDLAKLAVEALNDIGRVYDFPNLLRICKEGTQNLPVVLPASDTGWVLLAPLFSELHQVFQGFILCNRGVHLFQICHKGFDVLIADKARGRADLVNDTALYLALGIHGGNGFYEALQAIHAEQIHNPELPWI